MTRLYELALALNPELTDAELQRLGHSLTETLKKHEAEVTHDEDWGRRPTAYVLKGYREAAYRFFQFTMDPQKVPQLEQDIKLTQNVLRHLITLVDQDTPSTDELESQQTE